MFQQNNVGWYSFHFAFPLSYLRVVCEKNVVKARRSKFVSVSRQPTLDIPPSRYIGTFHNP